MRDELLAPQRAHYARVILDRLDNVLPIVEVPRRVSDRDRRAAPRRLVAEPVGLADLLGVLCGCGSTRVIAGGEEMAFEAACPALWPQTHGHGVDVATRL